MFSKRARSGKRRRRGPLADWVKVLIQTEQAEEQARKDAESDLRQQLMTVDSLTLRFTRAVAVLMNGELDRLGLHCHHREWRRKTIRTFRNERRRKLEAIPFDDPTAFPCPPRKEPDVTTTALDRPTEHEHPQTPVALREQAERAWVELVSGGDPIIAEQVRCQLETRRQELGWNSSSPLERLLVDRVALIEMQTQHADLVYGRLVDGSLQQGKFLVLRSAKLEARLRQMVAALALVRKLQDRAR